MNVPVIAMVHPIAIYWWAIRRRRWAFAFGPFAGVPIAGGLFAGGLNAALGLVCLIAPLLGFVSHVHFEGYDLFIDSHELL